MSLNIKSGPYDSRPIGVFDSGIGGLSVLHELEQSFPNESFVYLGDTARLPYGSKSKKTILKYVEQNISFFNKTQNVKAIVIACNSASTVIDLLKVDHDRPLFGVIHPGAKTALSKTKNNNIALWATRTTVREESYPRSLAALSDKAKCFSIPCPLLVPLVEEGLWDTQITKDILYLYVNEIKDLNVDTLILGCTHYPFIKALLLEILKEKGLNLEVIDSAVAMTEELKNAFNNKKVLASEKREKIALMLTDDASHFKTVVLKAFPEWKNFNFELVDIQNLNREDV